MIDSRHIRTAILALALTAGLATTAWAGVEAWTSNGPYGGSNLTLDPANPSTLYFGSSLGGLFRSTDGAASWTFIAGIDSKRSATSGKAGGFRG